MGDLMCVLLNSMLKTVPGIFRVNGRLDVKFVPGMCAQVKPTMAPEAYTEDGLVWAWPAPRPS